MSSPFWEYEENGVFYAFDQTSNTHIENTYLRNNSGQLPIIIFSASFLVDLAARTMTDQRTLNVQRIRRTVPTVLPNISQVMTKQRLYVWKYFNNGYRLFPERDNVRIERLFLKNSRAKFRLESGGQYYIIDFNNMTCVNEGANMTHQLFRQDASAIQKGFDAPSILQEIKPAIVKTKFTHSQVKRLHPSEIEILRHIGDRLPKRPNFTTVEIETPKHDIFDQVKSLPKLSDQEFNHGDSCAICLTELCHAFPSSPPFSSSEDYNTLSVSSLPCGHVFHRKCLLRALKARASCPMCKSSYQAVRGLQPDGKMRISYSNERCNGYKNVGSICVDFYMKDGIQSSRHENPGRQYHGDSRNHVMPATINGFRALRWLTLAWCQFVLFTIGYSPTRNQDDVITYGTIHLKTSTSGGSENHGWPDKDYFNRLFQECESAGLNVGSFDPSFTDRAPDSSGADDYLISDGGHYDDFDDDADKYGL